MCANHTIGVRRRRAAPLRNALYFVTHGAVFARFQSGGAQSLYVGWIDPTCIGPEPLHGTWLVSGIPVASPVNWTSHQ
jgi:hypothetical protein